MKKLYVLIAAMLVVSFSFAQIQPRVFHQDPHKIAGKPEFSHKYTSNSKTAAAGEWLCYGDAIWAYWGGEPGEDDINIGRVAVDSNGLTHYSDGTTGHGFFFGWGQTFDFNHSVWDDVTPEGGISMNYTNNYNLDSVAIIGSYYRGNSVPEGSVDTLIVAVNTTSLSADSWVTLSVGDLDIIKYHGVPYDVNTHLVTDAIIYKIPLTSADTSRTDEENHIFASEFVLPLNLSDITNKVINITYTFKHADAIPMDEDINNYSRFYAWLYRDPRSNYAPYDNDGNIIPAAPDAWGNGNHGSIIGDDNLNQPNPDAWYCEYLYPAQIWNKTTHYPWLLAKVSCNSCEIVNVPELEKINPTVYPNPATNNFTVNLGNDEKANIQLFNIVGQQVYSETITGTAQVNVANLNSGVYMLKINQNGKVYTTKVIVK